MASVGGITVSLFHVNVALKKTRVDVWEVPGLTGYGAITLGLGDSAFEGDTVTFCADSTAADAHVVALAALQGTLVTLIDAWGNTFTKVIVVHVDYELKRVIYLGNANAVRVQCKWKFCYS